MNFHIVALPHTKTTKEYNVCAYTQKVLNFCTMMSRQSGNTVYHYGAEGSNPICTEHITVITTEEQNKLIGDVDWQKNFFTAKFDVREPYWQLMNFRAIQEIEKRKKPGDFLCIIAGLCQKPIADALPDLISVEYGVGYTGTFADFKVYESYAHMHFQYGKEGDNMNGRFYDAVIPNYYDPADFPYLCEPENYYLMATRFIERKGIRIAVETCEAIDATLKIAGQGANVNKNGEYVDITGIDVNIHSKNVEHIGYLDIKKRAEILAKAQAVFVPTYYVEPFGGIAVEAMLCGTPVITTDWGAFAETVVHGKTGYRCRTLEQFIWAAKNVNKLNRAQIRAYAIKNYNFMKVADMYEEYFAMLSDLSGKGWYTIKERSNLDWLNRYD